jgi:hypothetical protein
MQENTQQQRPGAVPGQLPGGVAGQASDHMGRREQLPRGTRRVDCGDGERATDRQPVWPTGRARGLARDGKGGGTL